MVASGETVLMKEAVHCDAAEKTGGLAVQEDPCCGDVDRDDHGDDRDTYSDAESDGEVDHSRDGRGRRANETTGSPAGLPPAPPLEGDPDALGAPGDIPAKAAVAEAGHMFRPSDLTPTDETSDAFSTVTSTEGPYEVIEYDPTDNSGLGGIPLDILNEIEPNIGENTPAAEALRANANVHVSSVGKAARAVKIQAVRKFVKQATGKTRSGVVRGKPPRMPPKMVQEGDDEEESGDDEEGDEVEEMGCCAVGDDVSLEPIEEGEDECRHSPTPPSPKPKPQNLHHNNHHHRHHNHHHHRHLDGDAAIPDNVVAGTADAGKKVLGEVDPHDMLKLLRWRRKKQEGGASKEPKSYVKGKVIDGEHELYTLSIAVMIGVRTSISKTNTLLNAGPGKRWVQPQDFRMTEKYEFRPKGGKLPPHKLGHTFKFKDYAPVPFAFLRRMYGVNEFDFLLSICGNANFIEFISNAKSGQFFFYSSDGRYMIKTMTNAESKFLRRILPKYFRHCAENPNTTVTRFFGMYRVKLYHLRRNVKFVIMNSVYYTDKYLQVFYDLKGSTIGRDAKPGQAVKKDNDLRRGLPDSALALQPRARRQLRSQIEADCDFLSRMGIMDYSMLVGVHHVPRAEDRKLATCGFRGSMKHHSSRRLKNAGDLDHGHDFLESLNQRHGGGGGGGISQRFDGGSHKFEAISQRFEVGSHKFDEPDSSLSLNTPPDATNHREMFHRRGAESISAFFFDDGLDDDDCSYLMGSDNRSKDSRPALETNEETEVKKQATIEKLYWPFHRLFDIHGHRRMVPVRCPTCGNKPCSCGNDDEILNGYNIPKFVAPLSDRKDRGFELDTTGMTLPLKLPGPHGKDQLYDGKIFYMGIIDVLQEYTSRKKLEAQYRWMQSSSRHDASCVPPGDYGERFLHFFDEYSQRAPGQEDVGIETDISGVLMDSSSDPHDFHW